MAQQTVTVKLFALARQLAGRDSIELTIPAPGTVRNLRDELPRACPAIARLVGQVLIAVDSEYANDETPLDPASEIACIPPVSGG